MSNTEQKLRNNILTELQKLNEVNSPVLYKMIQTKKGYEHVEKQIILRVISDNLLPIVIIPQIEMEYEIDE